jgi:MFS family permease
MFMIHRLPRPADFLGRTVLSRFGPIIVSAPLAGRLADRFGARRPAIASAGAAITCSRG